MSKSNAIVTVAQFNQLKSQLNSLSSAIASMKKNLVPVPKRKTEPHEREEGLKERYKEYRDDMLANYVYGLYHPDIVYEDHLTIKSPSPMPIPTTSFSFKETFTIRPNASGNFVLWWNPNFLGTSDELNRIHLTNKVNDPNAYQSVFSNVYFHDGDQVDGNSAVFTGWKAHTFKPVLQDFAKYRLTSACIKVKYTGKVLDQSGMLAACATYSVFPRSVYSVPLLADIPGYYVYEDGTNNPILGKFGDFDVIRQGQWAHSVSLISEPDGITCVYLPTDPLNDVFVNNGTTIDETGHGIVWINDKVLSHWSPTNTNLGYAICGYGITAQQSSITVECYYNFEIIVQEDQMPYFRPTVTDSRLTRFASRIGDMVRSISSSFGGITTTKQHNAPSTMSRIRSALSNIGTYAGDIIPLVMKVGKALI